MPTPSAIHALVGLYEPGETRASLSALFSKLMAGLKPILAAKRSRGPCTDDRGGETPGTDRT